MVIILTLLAVLIAPPTLILGGIVLMSVLP